MSVVVDGVGTLYKRLEELRLMESRKSARLGKEATSDYTLFSVVNFFHGSGSGSGAGAGSGSYLYSITSVFKN